MEKAKESVVIKRNVSNFSRCQIIYKTQLQLCNSATNRKIRKWYFIIYGSIRSVSSWLSISPRMGKKKLYKKSKIYAKDDSAHVSKWRNNCDHELEDRACKDIDL